MFKELRLPPGLLGPPTASKPPVSRVGTVPLPVGTALIFLHVGCWLVMTASGNVF